MSSSFVTSNFEFNRFALLLSQYDYKVKQNDILAGSIVGLESTHALVDIGLDKVAYLPIEEIFIQTKTPLDHLLKNNFIGEFLILNMNKKTNKIIVSLNYVHSLCLWERLKQINFKNTIIYAKNENFLNKGKLMFFNGLKIFVLSSHIPKYYRRKKKKNFFIPFKFTEIKDFVHIVHVNSRLAIFGQASQNIEIGSIFLGCVNSIRPFGIFLNILGMSCLIHISKISQKKLTNIKSIYKRGDQIKFQIIYKDIDKGRILGSIKKSEINRHPQL